MLLRSAGAAGSEETLSVANGPGRKNTHTRTHTRARSPSMHPSTPWRSSGHFQRNFDTSNYGGLGSDRSIPGPNGRTEERRTDNRLGSRQRLGPSLSAASTGVSSPPGGLFKTSASASPCMFTHHYCPLSFPTAAVSFLSCAGSAEEGEKTASGQA